MLNPGVDVIRAALVVLLLVPVAGCSAAPGAGPLPLESTGSAAPLSPVELVAHSLDAISATTVHVRTTDMEGSVTLTVTGDLDLAHGRADILTNDGRFILIGPDIYQWPNSTPWVHYSLAKLGVDNGIVDTMRLGRVGRLLSGVVSAVAYTDGVYQCRTDLTRAQLLASPKGQDRMLNLLAATGAGAAGFPFIATVDGQDRLVNFTYNVPLGNSVAPQSITLTDYGRPVTVEAPRETTREATETEYSIYSQ
jgi:hypothetical protein